MTSTKRHAVLTVERANSSNTCESGLGFVIDDFFEAIGTAKKGLQCNALANLPPRVDYDVIAPLCDSQPYRTRTVDLSSWRSSSSMHLRRRYLSSILRPL